MKPTRWAQNRIDYIVHHNPEGVLKLIDELGYVAPKHPKELAKATRELVREEGQKAVIALLELHPDRKALMAVHTATQAEDSFCAACNHFSFTSQEPSCTTCSHTAYDGRQSSAFLARLAGMSQPELQGYYEQLLLQANQAPENTALGEEVRLVWNELRLRNTPAPSEAPPKTGGCGCGGGTKAASSWRWDEPIVLIGLVVAALVIGSAIR